MKGNNINNNNYFSIAAISLSVEEQEKYLRDIVKTLQRVLITC